MNVTFDVYLLQVGQVTQEVANQIRDDAALKRKTAFQQIYDTLESKPYGLDYETAEKYMLEFSKQSDFAVIALKETQGYECAKNIYDGLGGATAENSRYIVPLVHRQSKEVVVITTRPEDAELLAKVSLACRGVAWRLGVCSPMLMSYIHSLFVDPILITQMAGQLTGDDGGRSNRQDVIADSKTRSFLNSLLNAALTQRASDLHFIPCSKKECLVLFRVDGVNSKYSAIPLDTLNKVCNVIKNDAGVAVKDPHVAVDGKMRFSPSGGKIADDSIDIRLSIIPTKAGPDLNLRFLSSRLFSFEDIGMSEKNIAAYKRLLDLPSGMVVQVGPTGSGKSTTMYSGLEYIHHSMRNIITVEDPVEILMEGISQVDVNATSKFGFADALKACLRHDPDVVVVGELRDNETAALAVRAANTGHLVLTSIHANDSIGVIERLVNMGIDPYSLGEVLAAVMGQRLVRRLCPHCKQAYEFDLKSRDAEYYRFPNRNETVTLYRPVGCVKCNNTGYSGRIAINEIMLIDSELRNYIQRRAVRSNFEQLLDARHFQTMYFDGITKVMQGITSLDEMAKFAADTIAFKGKALQLS